MRPITWFLAAAIAAFALAGCGTETPPPPTQTPATPSAAVTPTYTLDATQTACPVTLPNGKTPPDRLASDGINYGNEDGSLYTILRPGGILYFDGGQGTIQDDGSLDLKWPWFRGIRGQLTVRERRLDAPGVTGSGDVPCCYADTGFQPSGLILPSAGCWEITGAIGSARLTFVMLVVIAQQ